MMNTEMDEMNNFIDIFWVNFAEVSLVLLQVQIYFKHQVKEQNLFW